ncbi:hypothetical protein M0812_18862 [Anaeramoeba flamelloides]|uniref:Uncharacterized protein n=1 Tax=Anaeramoeba flamelloides TaxID=1746091 RepID=A0AAV7Z9T1_9EUKA|nr:hypothetical protein M0812_18862 [Anaeramoeba flamelloides]
MNKLNQTDLYNQIYESISSGKFSQQVWESINSLFKNENSNEQFFLGLNKIPNLIFGEFPTSQDSNKIVVFFTYFQLMLYELKISTIKEYLSNWFNLFQKLLSSGDLRHIQALDQLTQELFSQNDKEFIHFFLYQFLIEENLNLMKFLDLLIITNPKLFIQSITKFLQNESKTKMVLEKLCLISDKIQKNQKKTFDEDFISCLTNILKKSDDQNLINLTLIIYNIFFNDYISFKKF